MEAPDAPMRERLTRQNLNGIWAAIATPFDEDDRFDEGSFRENMRRQFRRIVEVQFPDLLWRG